MYHVQSIVGVTKIFKRNKNSLIFSGKHRFFQTIENVPVVTKLSQFSQLANLVEDIGTPHIAKIFCLAFEVKNPSLDGESIAMREPCTIPLHSSQSSKLKTHLLRMLLDSLWECPWAHELQGCVPPTKLPTSSNASEGNYSCNLYCPHGCEIGVAKLINTVSLISVLIIIAFFHSFLKKPRF